MASQFSAYNPYGTGMSNRNAPVANNNDQQRSEPAQDAQGGGMPGGLVEWDYFFNLIGGDAYWGTFGMNPWELLGNLNGNMDSMMAAINEDFGLW